MTTNYPLTIEEFRNWLESKDEDEIVGEIRWTTKCPLANALLQRTYTEEGNQVRVRYCTTEVDPYFVSETLRFGNPDWVEKFISKIDALSDEEKSVTVKEVLEVLEVVEKYDLSN